MAAAFGRLRSPAAIVTMLAAGGKETSLASAEDACEIGTSLANGVCLSSTDGLEVGSVAWVLGPQGKAARKKLPRVKIADLLRRNALADDDGNECDISDGTMDRARCMDNYDPLSLTSAWVTNLTMLAAGGKEVSLAPTEDACEIGTSLANGVCLSSTDGLEVGSVAWVLGPRPKKLPRVKIADLLRRNAPADDDGNECDISDGTMDRARCMGNYDPLSLTSAWVLRGAKAVGAARSKLPGVKLGGLWGANAANPHDEVDACDTEGDTLARGLCLDEHDALSMASSNWVLSQLAKVKSQSPKSESARSSWPQAQPLRWSLQQRTPTIHPL
jgi:hypothetical protein